MKKLYRNSSNKVFGGICSGIAEYFNSPDLTWFIRLLFILFVTNISIVIYLLIWILTKEKEF